MLSRPLAVYWAGWKSDTYALQAAGWQLSAEQDIAYRTLRVALHHRELQCYALSQRIDDFRYDMRSQLQYGHEPLPPLHIQYFATRLHLNIHEVGTAHFGPIDAAPQFVNHEIKSIEDMKWFAAPLVRTEEIIVEPASVQEMLDRIREMQAPEQAQIRARQRLRESREGMHMEAQPRQQFHAQILSIAA